MPVIKGFMAAGLIAYAIMAMPSDSAAISSATGPKPWGEFSFGATNSFANACTTCDVSSGGNSFYLDIPPWDFTGSGFLIVQDAFIIGDRFRVFDNSIAIGDTSSPSGSGDCGSNPDVCFTNANVSQGIFALAAGTHSFTIQAIASPLDGGAAYLCVSTSRESCSPVTAPEPAPEPASMILVGLGLAGALFWVKRPQLSKVLVLIKRKHPRR